MCYTQTQRQRPRASSFLCVCVVVCPCPGEAQLRYRTEAPTLHRRGKAGMMHTEGCGHHHFITPQSRTASKPDFAATILNLRFGSLCYPGNQAGEEGDEAYLDVSSPRRLENTKANRAGDCPSGGRTLFPVIQRWPCPRHAPHSQPTCRLGV